MTIRSTDNVSFECPECGHIVKKNPETVSIGENTHTCVNCWAKFLVTIEMKLTLTYYKVSSTPAVRAPAEKDNAKQKKPKTKAKETQ